MKKKLLFILHLPPPVHGSAIVGRSIRNSTVINDCFECSYINILLSRTIDETGKGAFVKALRCLRSWTQLFEKLLANKPELGYLALTVKGKAFFKDVVSVSLLKLFKVKVVYHLHNKGVRQNEGRRIYRRFYEYVFKDAEVILLSKHLYEDIRTFVPATRIHICSNGIEDSPFEEPMQAKISDGPVHLLFLSNLLESKGIQVLLEACDILQQRGVEFVCNVVGAEGDWDKAKFNEEVMRLNLDSRVFYHGVKLGAEKEEAFRKADIFVHPTLLDCVPLVILEAMKYSLPVVSTIEGGIPDLVDEELTGFLVPKNDSKAFAERVERLVNDSVLRHTQGEAARHKFENEFRLECFEMRLKKILQRIV